MRYWLTLLLTIFKIRFPNSFTTNRQPDFSHPSRRRFTAQYHAKRSVVRNVWIAAGLLMLINPILPVIMIIALPTTLLSFMILDETP